MTYPIALLDGEVLDFRDVRLADFSTGFFFGAGLFETLRLEAGVPAFLDRHLARLMRSLAALPVIERPRDVALLDAGALRFGLAAAVSRLAATGSAPAPDVMKLTVSDGRVLVTFRALGPVRAGGIEIVRTEPGYVSDDRLRNHKTLAYLRSYAAMRPAVDGEALFANERGEVCEAPTANVFFVRDDRVETPPLGAPCLPGIIREVILEAGWIGGRRVVEAPLRRDRLGEVSACVLTNSVALASPVSRLFGRILSGSDALAADVRALVVEAARREARSAVHSNER